MGFDKCIELCIHHHSHDTGLFYCKHPLMRPLCSQPLPAPHSLAITDLFSVSIVWPLPKMLNKWNHTWIWLISYSKMHVRVIHSIA